MCSIDSVDGDNGLMKGKEDIKLVGALCRKCTETDASVILQGKFPYCRQCFLLHATHKFYAVLGKSKILKPKDKILIAFSGSNSSAALLHLVKDGLSENRKKKLVSKAVLLYVDEGSIIGQSNEERANVIRNVISYVEPYGFDIFIANLNCDYCDDIKLYRAGELDMELFFESNTDDSRNILDGIKSLTSKEDLVLKLRNNLIVAAAKQLDCNKIFTAETSDRLAINLLTNIALGRGTQLSQDVGFCDDRYTDIAVIRPMKDWSRKEVAFYNVFNNLCRISYPRLGTLSDPSTSIQKLTEKFVTDLQESFPSTVSTVLGTGSKIVSKTNSESTEESESTCSLCQGKLDPSNDGLSAVQSSKLSHFISTAGREEFLKSSNESEEKSCKNNSNCCKGSCKNEQNTLSLEKYAEHLCYGCNLLLKEMNDCPSSVLIEIRRRINLEQMRSEIQDFLL